MTTTLSRSLIVGGALLALAVPALAQPARGTGSATAQATPRPHAEGDRDSSAPQAFSVVLVLGEMQATATQDNVPAAARKALADMKDFLPYKGYRLLDTQWTLCCGNAPLTGRLKGADEQEYELQLTAGGFNNGHANVRFLLMEVGASVEASPEKTAAVLEIQLEQLRSDRQETGKRVEIGMAPATEAQKIDRQIKILEAELAQAKASPMKVRTGRASGVIDASFRMDVGETVVVGTSRMKGDKALIALLTAVPPKAGVR